MRVPAGRRLVSPGAGGAAGFTPDQLDGLVLWLDPTYGLYQERTGAGATTPAAADGDPVGTWRARTGQYFTASSDAERPTLRVIGGRRWVESDGGDDYLSATMGFEVNVTGYGLWCVASAKHTASRVFAQGSRGSMANSWW